MITEERLRLYLDDIYIYNFYFGDFNLNYKYNSPLRDDPKPSFQIKISKSGNLYWKDYGLDKQHGYDAIAFVMHYYDIDRKEAVKKIWNDIIKSGKPLPVIKLGADTSSVKYKHYYGELRDWEMKYWVSRLIPRKILDFFRVKSLTALYKTDKLIWKSTEDNPAYIYLYEDGKAFKAYRPLDPQGDKFRGQDNGEIIEGYDQLPDEWEHLIITKATKDVMTFRTIGVVSCSPTSENSFRTILAKKDEFNARFKRIFIFFDNDKAGIKAAKFLHEATGWTIIMLPEDHAKDPSDLVVKDGSFDRLEKFLSKLKLKRNYV